MDIQFLGHSSFKISGKKASIVTDPFDPKMVGIPFPKTRAEIVTVSHDHGDHNQANAIEGVKKVLNGPGEYEIDGISFIGISSFHDKSSGAERGKNTMYVIEVDGLRLAHLGDLGHELSDSQVNAMGEIDILMLPVGGVYTINSEEAVKTVMKIEPRIVIPMHFNSPQLNQETFGQLEKVDEFVNASGLKSETQQKLTVKEGDLSGEEQYIVILERK